MGTFVCGDCATWINSKDADRYGRKYCSFSRRYEESDQSIYWLNGRQCPGFAWARRAVLTKICEILNINPNKLFDAFDKARDNYVKPYEPELLNCYYSVAAYIINGLDTLQNKEELAKAMLNSYIIDAEANVIRGDYYKAVAIYSEMIRTLHIIFDVINERTLFHALTK